VNEKSKSKKQQKIGKWMDKGEGESAPGPQGVATAANSHT